MWQPQPGTELAPIEVARLRTKCYPAIGAGGVRKDLPALAFIAPLLLTQYSPSLPRVQKSLVTPPCLVVLFSFLCGLYFPGNQ